MNVRNDMKIGSTIHHLFFVLCWCGWLATFTHAAEPVTSVWIKSAAANGNAALAQALPEVRAVNVRERHIEIRSGGISLYSLGALQTPPDPVERLLQLRFQIPRFPTPAQAGKQQSVRPAVIGVFANGVPIYHQFETLSFLGQNLWHFDPLARDDDGSKVVGGYARDLTHQFQLGMLAQLITDGSRHSPLLGYAFDGYPIYGPWGFVTANQPNSLRRMRSGYRLRKNLTRRDRLANGVALTPAQFGPPVNAEFPAGAFVEDYEFDACVGDLDEFNGRFAVTPEYPQGTYAYFLSTDEMGRLAFPYLLASRYYGQVNADELHAAFYDAAAPIDKETVALDRPAAANALLSLNDAPLSLKVFGEQLAAQQSLRLSFTATGKNGAPVRHLEYVHERPLHLLVMSEDLSEFAHIHPMLTAGDRYEVAHTFEHGGRYRLYADYTAPGSPQRIARFTLDVPGPPAPRKPLKPDAQFTHTRNDVRATIKFAQPLRALAEIPLTLTLRDSQTDQPLDNHEPFLGAWAHFVVVDEMHESFIHAHPLDDAPANAGNAIVSTSAHTHDPAALGPPPAEIRTLVSFPRPGLYRLWAQFQRGGTVVTQPFTLQVGEAAPEEKTIAKIPADAIRLTVNSQGFAPAQLTLPTNRLLKLAITRDHLPNCANKILFPALGVSFDLPLGQTTVIELPPLKSGELSFSCGMGMYKGVMLISEAK